MLREKLREIKKKNKNRKKVEGRRFELEAGEEKRVNEYK